VNVEFPCRVCVHDCLMEQEYIQCDGCQCSMHRQCIDMTLESYIDFSNLSLIFCHQCCVPLHWYVLRHAHRTQGCKYKLNVTSYGILRQFFATNINDQSNTGDLVVDSAASSQKI